MATEVVVTGVGAVTALGGDAETTWDRLLEGESGAGPVTRFDADAYPQCVDVACEVSVDPSTLPGDERGVARYVQFLLQATEEALRDAEFGPSDDAWDADRAGTSVGTAIGGLPETTATTRALDDGTAVSPRYVLESLPNLCAGHVSSRFDAAGPSRTISAACATGTLAIADAVTDIRRDRADVMLAGSADAVICPTGMAGFGGMDALSERTDDRAGASRPFDEDRDGFVFGEGGGALVLESRDHAAERGAPVLATVTGTGRAADAGNPVRPPEDARGLRQAIGTALDDAGRAAAAVDHVNAHGTGTPVGDRHEAVAFAEVFETVPPVTAVKSMLGHAQGGAGAIDAVTAVQTIRDGVVPPTRNCENPDPACDLPVATEPTERLLDVVVSDSAGFGGTNAALVFESP